MAVHAFTGDDALRRQEALEAEVARWEASDPGSPAVRETHHGEELNAAAVAQSYQSPDLFAPRKTLIVRNFDKIRSAESRELLQDAFRNENPQAAVFLEAEKLDGRQGWVQALKKAGCLHEFKLPYGNKIPDWLSMRAKEKHKRTLGHVEARLLQDIVGNDTAELDHELEKLDTFLPKGEGITAEAIRQVVSPLKVHTMFEFQKAAGLGNAASFLPALRSLLEEQGGSESGIGPVIMLFNHFLKLTRIRAMLDEGANEQDIIAFVKLPPFIFRNELYTEQARKRPLYRWKQLLARLASLEQEMKQGRYAKRFEIETALAGVVLT